MKTVKMIDWSCVPRGWDGFRREPTPEEFINLEPGSSLHGKVFGHPKIVDGHRAVTSKIRSVNGNIITTESETIYELGKVLPEYWNWIMNESTTTT